MIRLILFLLLIGIVHSEDFCMVQFKQNMMNNLGNPFYEGPQTSAENCKKLCMARPDCVTCDYNNLKMCRTFNVKGVFYLVEANQASTSNTWMKFPTRNCADSSLLDKAIDAATIVTVPSGNKYKLRIQNRSTYQITNEG